MIDSVCIRKFVSVASEVLLNSSRSFELMEAVGMLVADFAQAQIIDTGRLGKQTLRDESHRCAEQLCVIWNIHRGTSATATSDQPAESNLIYLIYELVDQMEEAIGRPFTEQDTV